jgi:hypothetical protein
MPWRITHVEASASCRPISFTIEGPPFFSKCSAEESGAYSYQRLQLAQPLGQRGVFLTTHGRRPGVTGRLSELSELPSLSFVDMNFGGT